MRFGVGGGSYWARGGLSLGLGGLRGGIGAGPFRLTTGFGRRSGLFGTLFNLWWGLLWAFLVIVFWLAYLIVVLFVRYAIVPLVTGVLLPRWRAAETTGERVKIIAVVAGFILGFVLLVAALN